MDMQISAMHPHLVLCSSKLCQNVNFLWVTVAVEMPEAEFWILARLPRL